MLISFIPGSNLTWRFHATFMHTMPCHAVSCLVLPCLAAQPVCLVLVHNPALILELGQVLQSIGQGNQFALALRGLVVTVANVDRARLLLLGAHHC